MDRMALRSCRASRDLIGSCKRNVRTVSSNAIPRVFFSGIQPTGIPHIGNYLGAIYHWKILQDTSSPSDEFYYSIADLHALTVPQEAGQLRQWKRETLAALLSVGLDPERCAIFYQSMATFMFLSLLITEADITQGSSTYGTHVDFELHRFGGSFVTHDAMEG